MTLAQTDVIGLGARARAGRKREPQVKNGAGKVRLQRISCAGLCDRRGGDDQAGHFVRLIVRNENSERVVRLSAREAYGLRHELDIALQAYGKGAEGRVAK